VRGAAVADQKKAHQTPLCASLMTASSARGAPRPTPRASPPPSPTTSR
jgi:hypothetical protein